MSLLIRNIANTLQPKGIGTVGLDIFVEKMPATPDNALVLISTGSPAPDNELDTMYQNFEVWDRNQDTKTGGDIMDSVFLFLQRSNNFTLGGYYIYLIQAMGSIENYNEDSEGRKLFKQAYQIIYRDMRTVS